MNIDIFNDWRVDPFSGDSFEEDLEEVHLIEEFPSTPGIYGIIPNEVPYFSGAVGDITIVEVANAAGDPLSGGTVYNEVTFATAPASDEFRVDYVDDDVDTFYATGRINFNSSEDQKYVKINYKGLGTVVKSKYALNQVSVVPTNLYIEGSLSAEGAVSMQIDGPQIVNQLDPALDKGFFSAGVGITYTTDGTDGKTALLFDPQGSNLNSYYEINGIDTYIKNPVGGALDLLVHAKQDGSLDEGATLSITVKTYDVDFVAVSDIVVSIDTAELTTDYKWFPISFPAQDALYYRISIDAFSDTGIFYIDWVYGGDVSIPISIMSEIMAGSTVGHWLPTGQVGFSDVVWFDTAQSITLTDSATNYLITDSEKYYGRIKSVLILIRISTVANVGANVIQYEGNSGSTGINGSGTIFQYANDNMASAIEVRIEIPVSYYSGYQAGLRLIRNDIDTDSSATVNILGFRLK